MVNLNMLAFLLKSCHRSGTFLKNVKQSLDEAYIRGLTYSLTSSFRCYFNVQVQAMQAS